jgi:hypothetical protein
LQALATADVGGEGNLGSDGELSGEDTGVSDVEDVAIVEGGSISGGIVVSEGKGPITLADGGLGLEGVGGGLEETGVDEPRRAVGSEGKFEVLGGNGGSEDEGLKEGAEGTVLAELLAGGINLTGGGEVSEAGDVCDVVVEGFQPRRKPGKVFLEEGFEGVEHGRR